MNGYVLLTVTFAGLVHSGFSLGTSLLVLLSGHSLSRRRSHARLLRLTGAFILGALLMTFLLLCTLAYFGLLLNAAAYPPVLLASASLVALSGVWVLFFYYRRGHGTALWLPRSFARYLTERTAHTKNSAESFVLGAASVIYELPVTVWLLITAALLVGTLRPGLQVAGLAGYGVLSVTSLIVIFTLIGGGHVTATITRFRVERRRFLQAFVGLSLIVLGGALFWNAFYGAMATQGTLLW